MKFWNCMKSQCYLMVHSRNFWFSFWCMFLYSCLTYLYNVFSNQNANGSSILQGSSLFLGWARAPFSKYFVIFMPFILTITFSFSYFEENIFYMICSTFKAGKIKYILISGDNRREDIILQSWLSVLWEIFWLL